VVWWERRTGDKGTTNLSSKELPHNGGKKSQKKKLRNDKKPVGNSLFFQLFFPGGKKKGQTIRTGEAKDGPGKKW